MERSEKTKAASSTHRQIQSFLESLQTLEVSIKDAYELYEFLLSDSDEGLEEALTSDVAKIEEQVGKLEMQRFFTGDSDASHAYIDIQAGSGGTEAQDWAQMLMRMYLRWLKIMSTKLKLIK